MRLKIIIGTAILAFFSIVGVNAETPANADASRELTIKTSKASKALVETWASAYMTIHPDVQINVTSKQSAKAELEYVGEAEDKTNVVLVGRYAILPVTNSHNPIISELQKKKWNKSELKKLFFSSLDEDLDAEEEANSGKAGKLREKLTVYSGANASSATGVFAKHFGFQTSEVRGNKISGDDLYLLNAIEEDKQSITFNNIAYLYDTDKRQLKEDITILPINVNKEVGDILSNGNLDETLKVLEETTVDLIPVENFGFAFSNLNVRAELFLEWIVSEGQQYNNQKGFLKLDKATANKQLKLLAENN